MTYSKALFRNFRLRRVKGSVFCVCVQKISLRLETLCVAFKLVLHFPPAYFSEWKTQVSTAVTVKTVTRNVTLCSLAEIYRRLWGTDCLCLQGSYRKSVSRILCTPCLPAVELHVSVELTVYQKHLLGRPTKSETLPWWKCSLNCVRYADDENSFLNLIPTIKKPCSLPFSCAATAQIGPRPPLLEVSRSHSDTPHSVGFLWVGDQSEAETATWQHITHNKQTSMPPVGFELTIPASAQPKAHAATSIG
jgi:hypothetical protein